MKGTEMDNEEQERNVKRTAIFQDAINGVNDTTSPPPWRTTMWAAHGDTLWTAGTATAEGADETGMYFVSGDIIVRKSTIDGDAMRTISSFNIYPEQGMDPMRKVLEGIGKWENGLTPDRWGEVNNPGNARLTPPGMDRPLAMGWSDALARAAESARRMDPTIVQASLMQDALDHEPRPCVYFVEDNGYDVVAVEWHMDEQGRYDAFAFKHLQYDDISMQVAVISHSEHHTKITPEQMSDGGLLTMSHKIRDEYQALREHEGGPLAAGMTGRILRSGILKPGLVQKPLLRMMDGRTAPDWNDVMDQAAVSAAAGRNMPRRMDRTETTKPKPKRTTWWPNAWIDNSLVRPYTLHAKDGRDWPKMLVTMPEGTTVNGQDIGGWAIDLFMSDANRRQKDEGRGVNIRFRPQTAIELFHGRGQQRRTMTADPDSLIEAIRNADARAMSRDDGPIDDASRALAAKAIEESGPQIDRTADRLAEYRRQGTYRPETALKWARRIIDRTADEHGKGPWTSRQRRQASRLLLDRATERGTAAEPQKPNTETTRTGQKVPPAEPAPVEHEPTRSVERTGRAAQTAGRFRQLLRSNLDAAGGIQTATPTTKRHGHRSI